VVFGSLKGLEMNVCPNFYEHDRRGDGLKWRLSDYRYHSDAHKRFPRPASDLYVRILSGLCMSRGSLVDGRIVQDAMEITVLINMAGIMGAGISAFIGVKVALAQVQRDVRNLEKSQEKAERRLDRLEQRYFFPRGED